jgi:hypothetical protein
VEAVPPELKKRRIEIVDFRLEPTRSLMELQEKAPAILIWAEGVDKTMGRNRLELLPADEFAIYTAPPSSADLRAALETVHPNKVYLFGLSPEPEKADAFLGRMAGLAKYVINQKSGSTSVAELAGVTAQREGAIRLGLEWLAAGGHISILRDESTVHLSSGNHEPNQYLQRELYTAVKGILEETAAYRAHFQSAEAESLINLE